VAGERALAQLTAKLFFAPEDGRIWLDDQRMVLLHAGALGALRREVIHALGLDHGRELLERVGYVQGARDAEFVQRRWPDDPAELRNAAGPLLHQLEGFTKIRTVSTLTDDPTAHGEFLWLDSVEADEHLAAFGVADTPCCWMLSAYGTGYASTIFGRVLVFREVECRAMGAPHCRVIARPRHEWADTAHDFAAFDVARATSPARTSTSTSTTGGPRRGARPAADGSSVIGLSAPFVAARQMLERVAPTEATVLLHGESGVGKELFANTLHRLSARRDGPFVAVNCAAIPEGLIESELFGVERGAFTGATATRPGRFERASGGTLFLDEVAAMTSAAQGKLLRALQEREIERVGGVRALRVDVRVVAATNVDLWTEVEHHRFRRDLFFRLNVFPIDLPALRERRDDIPFLADHFRAAYTAVHKKPLAGFTQRAMRALVNYEYPGNVRELQNLVERGVIAAEAGGLVDVGHLFRRGEQANVAGWTLGARGRLRTADTDRDIRSPGTPPPPTTSPGGATLLEIEQQLCRDALDQASGNVSAAARALGLTRPTLEYRLRKWGLLPAQRRSTPPTRPGRPGSR